MQNCPDSIAFIIYHIYEIIMSTDDNVFFFDYILIVTTLKTKTDFRFVTNNELFALNL